MSEQATGRQLGESVEDFMGRRHPWFLRDAQGRYLMRWIEGFGPALTTDPEKAMRFATEHEARTHPAHSFPMTFLDPVAGGTR